MARKLNRYSQLQLQRAVLGVGLLAGYGSLASQAYGQTYSYTPVNNAPSTDLWSAGTNWTGSVAPVSGATTALTFGPSATAFAGGLNNINTDDISGPFQLNILTLTGNGPTTGTGAATITIAAADGSNLDFVANGAVLPVINLTTNSVSNAGVTYNVSAPITLDANTLLVGQNSSGGTLNFSGVISGSGSLAYTAGNGPVVSFSGANTFNGFSFNYANLFIAGSTTLNTDGSVASGPLGLGAVTLGGGVIGTDGAARTIANPVNIVASSVNFNGLGTLSLAGAVNLYTGSAVLPLNVGTRLVLDAGSSLVQNSLTKVGIGTATLQPSATYTNVSTVAINTGTLQLNFANTPTNILPGTATLTFNTSGTNGNANTALSVIGGSAGSGSPQNDSQTIPSVTFNQGVYSISDTPGTGSSDTAVLSLTDVTTNRRPGSLVDFNTILGSQPASATNGITTQSQNQGNTILAGWATVGKAGWATVNGSGNIIALPSASYSNDVFTGTGKDVAVSTGDSASSANINSLLFNPGTAGLTVTLTATNTIASGGVLNAGSGGNTIAAGTNGALRGSPSGELDILNYAPTGTFQIKPNIVDNGGPTNLVLAGTATTALFGSDTYTGTTYVESGTVLVSNTAGIAIPGPLTLGFATLNLSSAATGSPFAATTVITGDLGTFSLLGKSATVAGLSTDSGYAGSILQDNNTSAATLTLNTPAGFSGDYLGLIRLGSTGALNFVKAGPGTQIVGGTGGTGTITLSALTIDSGTFKVGGASVTSFTAPLTFGGSGTFDYDSGGLARAVSPGAVAFSAGDGVLQLNRPGANNVSLTISSLAARSVGATQEFLDSGTSVTATNTIITIAGTSLGLIDQGSFFDGNDYAFMNAANTFVRAPVYGTDSGFVTGASLAAGNDQVTASISNQPSIATIGTIKFGATSNVATSAINLTLASGATVTVGTSTTTAGLLRSGGGATTISGGTGIKPFAAAELVVRTNAATDSITINTPILANGTNALTKSGAGVLTLGSVNTYTGVTYVDGGTLSVSSDGNLGATTNANLNLNGGALLATTGFTTARPFVLGAAGGAFGVSTGQTLVASAAVSDLAATSTTPGAFTKTGAGTLSLTLASTYKGATVISGGTLSTAAALASTSVTIDSTANTAALTLLSATALGSSTALNIVTTANSPTINIDYNTSTDTVASLIIGGVSVPGGVYSVSHEPTADPSLFASDTSGTGSVTVAPEPGSIGALAVMGMGLLSRRRRRHSAASI